MCLIQEIYLAILGWPIIWKKSDMKNVHISWRFWGILDEKMTRISLFPCIPSDRMHLPIYEVKFSKKQRKFALFRFYFLWHLMTSVINSKPVAENLSSWRFSRHPCNEMLLMSYVITGILHICQIISYFSDAIRHMSLITYMLIWVSIEPPGPQQFSPWL